MSKGVYKRFFAGLLALLMVFSLIPTNALSNSAGKSNEFPVTKDVAPLITKIELEGVQMDENGNYYVDANESYSVKLFVQEKANLEMDMTDYVYFALPPGLQAADESNVIDIGVLDGYHKSIFHSYTIQDNVMRITWNKESPYFEDLLRAHFVEFSFSFLGNFDGSQDEIVFGDGVNATIKVDNTGSITITKNVSGLKPGFAMTDAKKAAMNFELRDESGNVVRSFTYADMGNGSISFDGMKPGKYTIVETSHPDFPNHTFDVGDSVTEKTGTLTNGGLLNLDMSNDYEYHKGNLILNKSIDCTNWDGSKTIPNRIKNKISFTITGPFGYNKTIPYTDFVNGKLELKGLDIGDYTVTEKNEVTGYTWTYKVNNGSPGTPSANVDITNGGTASVNFENKYVEKTGDLKIKKTASGATVPPNAEFRITFPNGSKRTIKYSEMRNGEYLLENVPLGTYIVDEIDDTAKVANYALTVTGEGSVSLNKANETKTTTIHNSYAPYGGIKINKAILGDLNTALMTVDQKKAIRFGVYDENNELKATLSYADIVGGNHTISNLPVGEYTVVETAYDLDGYAVVTEPASKAVTVNVSVGQTSSASFKNTYTKDAYKLKVNKTFGTGSAFNQSNLPEEFRTGTTYTVKVKSSGRTIASCTYDELAATLNELILSGPGPYIIEEHNPSVDGVDISTTVSKDGGKTYTESKSIELTVENHKPATVTFKNTYTLQGKIKGDKTVNGLKYYDEASIRSKIRFTIYRNNNGNLETYRTNVTLSELENGLIVPIGNYVVKESNVSNLGVPGYNGPTVTNQVDDGAVQSGSTSNSFTVVQNGTTTVHFTNSYTLDDDKTTLSLVKSVEGVAGNEAQTNLTASMNIFNANGDLLYDAIRFKVEEKVDGTWHEYGTYTLQELSTGINLRAGQYRLTELYADVPGYTLDIQYSIGVPGVIQSESDNQVILKIDKDQTLVIGVLNAYTPLGNLKIVKEISGAKLSEAERKAIVFTVTGPNGFSKTFNLNEIYNSKTGKCEITYNNVPVGVYTVTEAAGNTTKYNLTVSNNLTDNQITVSFGQTATAEFENEYTRKVGSLTVKKTMEREVPESFTEEQKKAMAFTVKNSAGRVVGTATYDMFENGAYTFTNLPTGTYTVEEKIGDVLTDDYRITITSDKESATVAENGNPVITITNTFLKSGSLKLNKTFAGTKISDELLREKLAFQYWRIDEEGQIVGDKHTVSYNQFVNGSYTVKNLVPGKYVVEELDDTTGYVRSTTVAVNGGDATDETSATVDISFGQTEDVTFHNTYSEIASLVITKTIAGVLADSMSDEQKQAIRFTVVDSDGKAVCEPFTYFEMTDGRKTIENVPTGIYTVTEEVTQPALFNGLDCKTTYQVGSSTAVNGTVAKFTAVHGSNTIAFKNDYSEIDPLHVDKHSSDTYIGKVNINGAMFPVWRFELTIDHLNPLTTRDGKTVLVESFDKDHADWFRLATASELQQLGVGDGSHNTFLTSLIDGKNPPVATYNEGNNKITISGITADTAEKCKFTYYLIVNDSEDLSEMNSTGKTRASGVHHQFKNTISYQPMPYSDETETDNADYKYRFTAVDKAITNIDEEGNLYDVIDGQKVLVNYADYSIRVNPDGMSIGDQPTITAIDAFSENQTVLLSSIRTNPSENVSYKLDNQANKIEFTIPNATPVEITYRTIITDVEGSQVTLSNEITLLGFVEGIHTDVFYSASGAGQGAIYSINLIKVDELDNSLPLKGVWFSLHDADGNELVRKETGENGEIEFKYWGENGSFMLDKKYYLVEESTIPGYNLKSEPVWFKISKNMTPGVDEDGVNILNNNGELIVSNAPISANMAVTKTFNDWSKQGTFKFKLTAVGNAPMPAAGGDIAVATEENPTAAFGVIRYNLSDEDFETNEPLIYRYKVQEIVDQTVDGVYYDTTVYDVTVTITDTDGNGVREVAVVYGDNQSSLTVTNKYETVEVSGSKDWRDADDQDGMRPASITINLLENGNKIATKTVTEADGWEWKFTNLPKFKNGQEVTYSITEDPVEEYTTTYEGYDVINTHIPEVVEVSGEKTWEDADNQDGMRPEEITINLLKNGKVIDTKTVTEADNWEWKFTDLPKYEKGNLIDYSITEEAVAEYTTEYDGYNVINTHIPEVVEVSGSKEWKDADNQDGMRPEVITINLLKDGKEIDSVTVTEADGWEWKFTNLPKYEKGNLIDYSITEDAVAEYTTTYEGYNVINTHIPEVVEVGGSKDWRDADDQDGMRPEEITINLLKNGEVIDTKIATEADNWEWKFTNLPKYEDGKEIVYSITEETVAEYTTEYDGYNVINTHIPEVVEVSGSKTWEDANDQDGKRPAEIIINLLKNGEVIDTKTVTEADNWEWKFTDLPKYEKGKELTYSITEEAVAEYTTEYDGYNVINTHIPELIDIEGKKTWDDADDQDGKRPEKITINLLKNDEIIDTVVVTEKDDWSWTFADLPKYEDGKEIAYSISEEPVNDYTSKYDGFNVTNQYTPESGDISGSKTWNDADNQDGKRPAEIIINLLKNGEVFATKTVTEADGWSWTFTRLPKYEDGKKIVYTISEETVAEYTTEYDGYNVINTHVPEFVEISGSKTWDDADNQDGKRPAEITINLVKNGEVIATKTVGEADDWSWTFTDLPKYEGGKEIAYSISEVPVKDYTPTYDGYDVTNHYTPGKCFVPVTKIWKDKDDHDGIRPEKIKVVLLANGKRTGLTLELHAGNAWKGMFTDLDEYVDGQKVVYTVEEKKVPKGYTSVISGTAADGFVITNTHEPSENGIPKTGDDNHLLLWGLLFATSGAAFASMLFARKRK